MTTYHIFGKIKHVHGPNIGFPEEEELEVLKAGELVIIDLDYIYDENDTNIEWPDGSSISRECERRYRADKNKQRLEKIRARKMNESR